MLQYAIRRLLQAIIVIFGVTLVAFSVNFLAGDPTLVLLGGDTRGMSQEDIEAFRHQMGFDRPVHIQYFDWLTSALQGDLGTSYRYRQDNLGILKERLPATFQLAGATLLLSLIISIPLGVVAATHQNSFIDQLSMVFALVGQSVPSFWAALMLMMIFAVRLGWFPVSGKGGIEYMVLPVITMSFFSIARNTRMVRSSMLEVLNEDYIRTAKSKGLGPRVVLIRHALRNALIPVVTLIGLDMGGLLGGSLIVETIFAWPGMGWLTILAIQGKDLPLVQAAVIMFALVFVITNLIVDFTYTALDPRVRLS
ncbi:MAG: ABC transporter permease [Anaerolineaceae bacterium]|nr:ABC transporter permease [Anaerolineaceae bacterium]